MASFPPRSQANQLPEGAIVKENGDVVYPATKRPDGTWRKERLIRKAADGTVFVPQEERRAFETRASRMRQASAPAHAPGAAPPPGAAPAPAAKAAPAAPASKAQRKNENRMKRRAEARESGDAARDGAADGVADEAAAGVAALSVGADKPAAAGADGGDAATEETPEQILAKRVKALKKKLKAIDQLQAEVDAGKVAAPSKDQLEKLARRAELAAELAELESGS